MSPSRNNVRILGQFMEQRGENVTMLYRSEMALSTTKLSQWMKMEEHIFTLKCNWDKVNSLQSRKYRSTPAIWTNEN